MSDASFLQDCAIEESSSDARIALAVRRGIANVGCVDPLFIFPTDRFPEELEVLPLWDSMDFVELHCEIEAELGEPLPDGFEPLPHLYRFTVREFVLGACKVMREKRENA